MRKFSKILLLVASGVATVSLTTPAQARQGADDGPGDVRQCRGCDDPPGDVRQCRGCDDPVGHISGGDRLRTGDDRSGSGSGGSGSSGSGRGGSGRGGTDDPAGHQ